MKPKSRSRLRYVAMAINPRYRAGAGSHRISIAARRNLCIERQNGSETHEVESEVVGLTVNRRFRMPLEEVEGVLPGARVYAKNISA
ncbi:hypothetical protein ACLK1T_24595 [Escherichia coli]